MRSLALALALRCIDFLRVEFQRAVHVADARVLWSCRSDAPNLELCYYLNKKKIKLTLCCYNYYHFIFITNRSKTVGKFYFHPLTMQFVICKFLFIIKILVQYHIKVLINICLEKSIRLLTILYNS